MSLFWNVNSYLYVLFSALNLKFKATLMVNFKVKWQESANDNTHVQEQKKAMLPLHFAYIPSSVKSP